MTGPLSVRLQRNAERFRSPPDLSIEFSKELVKDAANIVVDTCTGDFQRRALT
jgi:hypothetical protein